DGQPPAHEEPRKPEPHRHGDDELRPVPLEERLARDRGHTRGRLARNRGYALGAPTGGSVVPRSADRRLRRASERRPAAPSCREAATYSRTIFEGSMGTLRSASRVSTTIWACLARRGQSISL